MNLVSPFAFWCSNMFIRINVKNRIKHNSEMLHLPFAVFATYLVFRFSCVLSHVDCVHDVLVVNACVCCRQCRH